MILRHFHLAIEFSKRFSFVIKIQLNVIGIYLMVSKLWFNDVSP